MHVRLHSFVLTGLDGQVVDVEVDVASGFPQFLLVGLADTVVQEAKERVRSAIKNSGFKFPEGRVTVSLSPSHVRKEGAWFDLPIAMGLLLASRQVQDTGKLTPDLVWLGELGLDGSVRSTGKELAQLMAVGNSHQCVIATNALEQLLGVTARCAGVPSLQQAARLLHTSQLEWSSPQVIQPEPRPLPPLLSISGAQHIQRALHIALVGQHHTLLYGPPGTGKTILSQLTQHWAPDLSLEQALETGRVWSAADLNPKPVVMQRCPPFRSPHHTASAPAMVGGGHPLKPGEISLSHQGLLFLDELPEFRREVLEALREPLQEGVITINRAQARATFPAQAQVVATLNPCPCGFLGDDHHPCTCSAAQLERYRRKLSGPLLDRFSVCVRVDRVDASQLLGPVSSSSDTTTQVLRVRQHIQTARQRLMQVRKASQQLNLSVQRVLSQAADRFGLSPRAILSTKAIAESIAAFDQHTTVQDSDMLEALQYRWRGWEAVE